MNSDEQLKKEIKAIIRARLDEVGVSYIDEEISEDDSHEIMTPQQKTAQEKAEIERMKREVVERKRINQEDLDSKKEHTSTVEQN